eukprot:7407834-Lingulodinium_polyedra.AAC.1
MPGRAAGRSLDRICSRGMPGVVAIRDKPGLAMSCIWCRLGIRVVAANRWCILDLPLGWAPPAGHRAG